MAYLCGAENMVHHLRGQKATSNSNSREQLLNTRVRHKAETFKTLKTCDKCQNSPCEIQHSNCSHRFCQVCFHNLYDDDRKSFICDLHNENTSRKVTFSNENSSGYCSHSFQTENTLKDTRETEINCEKETVPSIRAWISRTFLSFCCGQKRRRHYSSKRFIYRNDRDEDVHVFESKHEELLGQFEESDEICTDIQEVEVEIHRSHE